MQLTIYRSSVKDGLYVFVKSDTTLESLPMPVRKQLGAMAEKAMELDLEKGQKLSNSDAGEVLEAIEDQGFYVQMPRDTESIMAQISGTKNVPKK